MKIAIVLLVLLTGCSESTTLQKQVANRVMQTNILGVKYFVTCIEGYRFIATDTTHYYTTLAGPVGPCLMQNFGGKK